MTDIEKLKTHAARLQGGGQRLGVKGAVGQHEHRGQG